MRMSLKTISDAPPQEISSDHDDFKVQFGLEGERMKNAPKLTNDVTK